MQSHSALLPQSAQDAGRLTVVLDLDQCLVDMDTIRVDKDEDTNEALRGFYGVCTQLTQLKYRYPVVDYAYDDLARRTPIERDRLEVTTMRPGLIDFLLGIHDEFEVIVFTGGLQEQADRRLNHIVESAGLDPKLFRHRLYRQDTVDLGSFAYVKDLRTLGRPMERIVLIENSHTACVANPDNCVLVPSFIAGSNGATQDCVLEKQLLPLLRELAPLEDVRPRLIETQRFRELMAEKNIKLPGPDVQARSPTMEATLL